MNSDTDSKSHRKKALSRCIILQLMFIVRHSCRSVIIEYNKDHWLLIGSVICDFESVSEFTMHPEHDQLSEPFRLNISQSISVAKCSTPRSMGMSRQINAEKMFTASLLLLSKRLIVEEIYP